MTKQGLIKKYEFTVTVIKDVICGLKYKSADPNTSDFTKRENKIIIFVTTREMERMNQFITDLKEMED